MERRIRRSGNLQQGMCRQYWNFRKNMSRYFEAFSQMQTYVVNRMNMYP